MSQVGPARLIFVAEYYDDMAEMMREYSLQYFLADQTVSMYDIRNRREFLKRMEVPTIREEHLYLGSQVVVHSRKLKLTGYGDAFTAAQLEKKSATTLAMVKPDAFASAAEICAAAADAGLVISQMRTVQLSQAQAQAFYAEHRAQPFYAQLVSFMASGKILAMELMGEDAVPKWRGLMESLRPRFGSDATRNAVHGSDSAASAEREAAFFFGGGNNFDVCTPCQSCSLALILPSAIKGGQAANIMAAIAADRGGAVNAVQMFTLTKPNAEEFYEVYKGVVADYTKKVSELASGPCIAVEFVSGNGAVETLREICGPSDPDVARTIRPASIRAKFGVNAVQNAVHVTDLPEDGCLEVEYFFNLLASSA